MVLGLLRKHGHRRQARIFLASGFSHGGATNGQAYRANVKKQRANGKKEGDKHFALPREESLQTSCAIASTGCKRTAIRIAGHFLVCYRAIHAIQQTHFSLVFCTASPDPELSLVFRDQLNLMSRERYSPLHCGLADHRLVLLDDCAAYFQDSLGAPDGKGDCFPNCSIRRCSALPPKRRPSK